MFFTSFLNPQSNPNPGFFKSSHNVFIFSAKFNNLYIAVLITSVNNLYIAVLMTVSNGGQLIRGWDTAQGTLHWEMGTGFIDVSE